MSQTNSAEDSRSPDRSSDVSRLDAAQLAEERQPLVMPFFFTLGDSQDTSLEHPSTCTLKVSHSLGQPRCIQDESH